MAVITITNDNFKSKVTDSGRTVVLDFWATWCGPCLMVSPVLDEIAEEKPEIDIGKVNVDEEPDLATQFGITLIPTIIIMKGGKAVATSTGYKQKAELLALIG